MSDPILTIQGYTDKSFVVRGDSKPYKEYFKGKGRWNSRLQGGEGWIFSYGKDNATYNEIYYVVQDINSGKLPPIEVPPRSSVVPPMNMQLPGAPRPIMNVTRAPMTASVPCGYQTVSWVVRLPVVNDNVIIVSEENRYKCIISEVHVHNGMTDVATIRSVDDDNFIANIVIINGEWQVHNLVGNHTIEFIGHSSTIPSSPSITLPNITLPSPRPE